MIISRLTVIRFASFQSLVSGRQGCSKLASHSMIRHLQFILHQTVRRRCPVGFIRPDSKLLVTYGWRVETAVKVSSWQLDRTAIKKLHRCSDSSNEHSCMETRMTAALSMCCLAQCLHESQCARAWVVRFDSAYSVHFPEHSVQAHRLV